MKNLKVYLGVEGRDLKKVVTALNAAEAGYQLEGLKVVKLTGKTHFYLTDETSSELQKGRVAVIMSITKSPSITPVQVSNTHIMFGSRVFEVSRDQQSIGQFTSTWSGNQKFTAWIKLGVELEGWRIVEVGKVS